MLLMADGQTEELRAGDVVRTPSGTIHLVTNTRRRAIRLSRCDNAAARFLAGLQRQLYREYTRIAHELVEIASPPRASATNCRRLTATDARAVARTL